MHTMVAYDDDDGPIALRIGERVIDEDSEPYIVAEAGVNHNGQLAVAKELCDAAKESGADAIKFQAFSSDSLTTQSARAATYQQATADQTQHNLLSKLELSAGEFRALSDHCRDIAIEFLATPFSVDDLSMILDVGVRAVKIASTDINDVALLDAVIASGQAIILSTGASELQEIDEVVSTLDNSEACERTILMHCVSAYPTAVEDASLSTIGLLRQRYDMWAGYSDHTLGIDTAAVAVACGARIIEKHMTLDAKADGPDHRFSLEPSVFAQYVAAARKAWALMGEPRHTVLDCEREVHQLARKSVTAQVDIAKGQTFSAEQLTVKRPNGGLAPKYLSEIIGKTAAVDIPAETQLQRDMVR